MNAPFPRSDFDSWEETCAASVAIDQFPFFGDETVPAAAHLHTCELNLGTGSPGSVKSILISKSSRIAATSSMVATGSSEVATNFQVEYPGMKRAKPAAGDERVDEFNRPADDSLPALTRAGLKAVCEQVSACAVVYTIRV
jgi:hypothetical protein